MDRSLDSNARPGTDDVTFRYWASLRAVAGTTHDEFDVPTLDALLAAACERHRDEPRFAQVLGICSLLIGDRPLGRRDPAEVALRPGDIVDALPPFAGG